MTTKMILIIMLIIALLLILAIGILGYTINIKLGMKIAIIQLIILSIINWLLYGYLWADIYLIGPTDGYYGETSSTLSIIVCVIPPLIIIGLGRIVYNIMVYYGALILEFKVKKMIEKENNK